MSLTNATWVETESDGSAMRVFVSAPRQEGRFPGLLVMQHQGGVDQFLQHAAERLAQSGFLAAAPDLYHRDGLDCQDDIVTRRSRLSDRRILNDIAAVISLLERDGKTDMDRLGVIGFCMGGRLAYLGAAANPAFKACVTYYPGNTFRAWGRDLPSPFERTAQIGCPVQGHFGADDANPSPADMAKLDQELTSHDKPHEFYLYENAGHAFLDFTKESYRKHADEASWPRTLEFLARLLQRGSPN